jgi:toxin ParE1/3/4
MIRRGRRAVAQGWRVRLGAAAERDFANILRWTRKRFGAEQARQYRDTMTLAIREFAQGPEVRGAKRRDDIMPGLYMLHVARHGRRGRHLLLYRQRDPRIVEIGRILHDSMDVRRHPLFSDDENKD